MEKKHHTSVNIIMGKILICAYAKELGKPIKNQKTNEPDITLEKNKNQSNYVM